MPSYPIAPLDRADAPDVLQLDRIAFLMATPPAGEDERVLELLEFDRSLGARDERLLVGSTFLYSFRLSVPGGVVPAAGVSWVAVRPTHRRRGVLGSLMRTQLHGLHDEGREAVAVLWAAEPAIYGRFGYGVATSQLEFSAPRQALRRDAAALTGSSPQLRLLPAAEVGDQLSGPYDAALADRSGLVERDDRWWRRMLHDPEHERQSAGELFAVLAEGEDGPLGYALYRTREQETRGRATGEVRVRELVAPDPSAATALWRYLFDLDLTATVAATRQPVDDPLLHLLSDPRAAQPVLTDGLYVRLVDVDRALAQRTYEAPVDVVLEVDDPVCPWNAGRWRLSGDASGATCGRTTDPADLTLGVAELGAAYLGGTTLVSLAAAGRVREEASGALLATSRAFATARQPWCPSVF